MSDPTTRSGISRIAAAGQEDEEAGVDLRQPSPKTDDIPADAWNWPAASQSLHEAHSSIAELRTAYLTLSEQIQEIGQAVQQLQGQAQQLDVNLPGYVNAIRVLDGRVTAIGQQVARNARLACIEAAARARGPGDSTDTVMKLVKAFLDFLEPHQVVPSPANGEDTDELKPGGWVAH